MCALPNNSGPASKCHYICHRCSGLILGRLVGGFGIGASAIVVPAYLAEMAPARNRGAIVQIYEVAV